MSPPKIGPLTTITNLSPKHNSRFDRKSIYDGVFTAARKLSREGQAFEIFVPDGTKAPVYRNRLHSAIIAKGLVAPTGLTFGLRESEEKGKIIVVLVPARKGGGR